jgi:hypothetical protein
MKAGGRLERHARRLAADAGLTRRQAIGTAAVGGVALVAGRVPTASAQIQPTCPPSDSPDDTQICEYTKDGVSSWICCRQDQVCCSKQPLVGGHAVVCCEPGQSCCYSATLGYWGCCGCPTGLRQCGTEPMTSKCCRPDEVCDQTDFICRRCTASKSCAGECCSRGQVCTGAECEDLVDYTKPPPRQRPKDDKLDSPTLKTFDSDVAADVSFNASTGAGSSAGASARGYLIGHAHVKLRAHSRRVVHVPLTRRAKRRLRQGKRIPAQLTLTFRDPAGRRIVETERVTIVPARRS